MNQTAGAGNNKKNQYRREKRRNSHRRIRGPHPFRDNTQRAGTVHANRCLTRPIQQTSFGSRGTCVRAPLGGAKMQRNLPGRLAVAAVFAAMFSVCRDRNSPGSEKFRAADHDESAAQWTHDFDLREAGSAGLQLRDLCGCGRCRRSLRARAGWHTCLSTSPSKAPTRLAPRTTLRKR